MPLGTPGTQGGFYACAMVSGWWNQVCKFVVKRYWGWRRLLPEEQAFVRTHFGAQQAEWLAMHARIGVRHWGDTRRALCASGARVSFPKVCFADPRQPQALNLQHPQVAGIVAHELLHALQRRAGIAVTWQALGLQLRWLCGGANPYAYTRSATPQAQLRQFWRAQVEQQGQMWEDCVQAQVAGQPLPHMALVARAVRAGRLQPRARTGR